MIDKYNMDVLSERAAPVQRSPGAAVLSNGGLRMRSLFKAVAAISFAVIMTSSLNAFASPYGSSVISYVEGSNAQAGYTDPTAALGSPARVTAGWPSGDTDVTMFNSPWQTTEAVSIGAGGSLVLAFDHQVVDDALNPFGIDLLIFGNTSFSDVSYPDGIAGGTWSEPGLISVSQDGSLWYDITSVSADDLFPTQGYTNTSGPYAADGTVESNFLMPVDPSIDWNGKNYSQLLALYDGSGGGAGVDISEVGLDWIQYVMISQSSTDTWSTEIDAISDVQAIPEPATLMLVVSGIAAVALRRRCSI